MACDLSKTADLNVLTYDLVVSWLVTKLSTPLLQGLRQQPLPNSIDWWRRVHRSKQKC